MQSEPEGDAAFLDGEKLVVRLDGQEEVVALRRALRLPGTHNVANALAASAAALAFGVKPWQIAEALATFSGLPHRLEMVARGPQQVTFYNDSIATTPESAICALRSFEGPITLIAGGYDKGSPFDELGLSIAQRARRSTCTCLRRMSMGSRRRSPQRPPKCSVLWWNRRAPMVTWRGGGRPWSTTLPAAW